MTLADMRDVADALDLLETMVAQHGRDWAQHYNDSVIYHLAVGVHDDDGKFDEQHLTELAEKWGWPPSTVDTVRRGSQAIQHLIATRSAERAMERQMNAGRSEG